MSDIYTFCDGEFTHGEGITFDDLERVFESMKPIVPYMESEFVPLKDKNGFVLCCKLEVFGDEVLLCHPDNVDEIRKYVHLEKYEIKPPDLTRPLFFSPPEMPKTDTASWMITRRWWY